MEDSIFYKTDIKDSDWENFGFLGLKEKNIIEKRLGFGRAAVLVTNYVRKDDGYYYFKISTYPYLASFTSFYDLLDFLEMLSVYSVDSNRFKEILEDRKVIGEKLSEMILSIFLDKRGVRYTNQLVESLGYLLNLKGLSSILIDFLIQKPIRLSKYNDPNPNMIKAYKYIVSYKHFDLTNLDEARLENILNVYISLTNKDDKYPSVVDELLEAIIGTFVNLKLNIGFFNFRTVLNKTKNPNILELVAKCIKVENIDEQEFDYLLNTLWDIKGDKQKTKIVLDNLKIVPSMYVPLMRYAINIDSPYTVKVLLSKPGISKYIDMEKAYKAAWDRNRYEILDLLYKYLNDKNPSIRRSIFKSFKDFFG